MSLAGFAERIRNTLWLLGVEAEYDFAPERARWTAAPYVVDLRPNRRVTYAC